jgi:hypothetical protein
MKKEYITPEMEIIRIQTAGMLAASSLDTETIPTDEQLAPEFDISDFC